MRLLHIVAAACLISCVQTNPVQLDAGRPATVASPPAPAPPAPLPSITVHFSPKGGCTESVASFIRSAKKSVHLQAYGFTSPQVADALCDRAKAGLGVEVVLDRSNSTDKHSVMQQVEACGAKSWIDAKHQIAHNKVTIIDGESVETGSFNYTQAAEIGNAENCLVIMGDTQLAAQYEANFQAHKAHSAAQ